MLKKSDLTVIRGGALALALPDEKFVDAYATDTRLMGVIVIYIKWQLSGRAAAGRKSRLLHQFFYVETTEEGIESYSGVYGDEEEELRFVEQSMLGGLGAARVLLSMNEALFLVQRYAEMTRGFGNPLPDETEEYAFVLGRETAMGPEREEALFFKLCGEVASANQLINYFLMRYFAKDFFPVDMLAAGEIDHGQLADAGSATLCRNEISPTQGGQKQNEGSYVCESVIEDDRGHRIVVSEVAVTREQGRLGVSSFEISSSFAISAAEAAMKLARPEYATVYEIAGSVENVIFELDERYAGALQNLTEGGKLYINFNDDNRHMGNSVYLLNDDVKEILYVTVEDQLVVGSYSLAGIKRLENRMMLSRIVGQLIEVAKYEFKEPILYDYTMSYGGDFVHYVEDMMGFDDDGDE
ncbi:MAG: hypothetical protein LBS91_09220 [Clostridiales Family XIII bacterium]|jgi:hypothetical protein|nr:hypothetical protein [Clostridiales Family XIII bacterium]